MWVKSESAAKTILVVNAMLNAEYLPPLQVCAERGGGNTIRNAMQCNAMQCNMMIFALSVARKYPARSFEAAVRACVRVCVAWRARARARLHTFASRSLRKGGGHGPSPQPHAHARPRA